MDTLEHFKKYSNHLIFSLLLGLFFVFTFSIKEELKIGDNDGILRIQAQAENAEESLGYAQQIYDITINGISIKEEDVVKNEWNYSDLDIVEPFYSTGGTNGEILEIKINEPIKTLSFYYSKNVNRGFFDVYIGDRLVSKTDAYSNEAERQYVTLGAPRYYGISIGNALWYLVVFTFALAIVLFSYLNIYKEFTKMDFLKLCLTSFGSALILYLTSQYLSEDYVNIFSLSYYPQYKIFVPVILAIFFTQISVISLRYTVKNIENDLWRSNAWESGSRLFAFKDKVRLFFKFFHKKIIYYIIYLVAILSPLFSYFLLQNSYSRIGNVDQSAHFYNLLLMYILFLLIFWISTSLRFSIVLIIAVGLVLGILNKVMIDVRDAPLMYYNLFQIQDGLNVASKVAPVFTQRIFQSVILGCVFLSLATFLPMKPKKIAWWKRIVVSILGLLVTVFALPFISKSIYETADIKLSYWRMDSTYSKNGFPLSFVSYYEDSKIAKPQGYSYEKVEQLLNVYPVQKVNAQGQLPNIIVIQNESQTDFSNLPGLQLTNDPLRFQH
ncbi:phosphoglycerol transferase/alkaline phosphatase superfamily protein [Streptococcus varani]|uniref:Phosphoglycerol transferase/alkaline phosphatase superfamily protein n=1 Tax=Streptococcus varani TaxID=1608583 RepID=A0A0E4H851_9STRE|nr:phosphoglycerol transferase/alkaline phosphatase superfamily protein [Streptococcus varani]